MVGVCGRLSAHVFYREFAMFMNLTDVFTSEGKDREEIITFGADEVSYIGNTYRILEKSPVQDRKSVV